MTNGKEPTPFVSILIFTHNAPDYVRLAIASVRRLARDVAYEIVVVDNALEPDTRELVKTFAADGAIDRFFLSPENTLFAKGNNIAAKLASPSATHLLLLNSDIEIFDGGWLKDMLSVHKPGITACQIHENPKRVDGWCFLIDAGLCHTHRLDERHEWWGAVTKLQAKVLSGGLSVQGIRDYSRFIVHFGGKSGNAFKDARGMSVPARRSAAWFEGHNITEVEVRSLEPQAILTSR